MLSLGPIHQVTFHYIIMKLRFATVTLFAGLLVSCDDDVLPEKVPLEVRQNLLNTFPLAFDIEWERSGKDYEADFNMHAVAHSALFRQSGELMQYKRNLQSSELPEAVARSIAQSYPNYKTEEAEVVVKGDTTTYQVVLKGKSGELELAFSAEGQQLPQAYWD
ncbi:hypothetical protein O71_17736 [Pontibacter sp. BAB1700]|uniref:Putative beta-lactamase-inhibitor-like, PepSY-like n=2 Tax=Hymenobacteraceae TaxID=1853232 RepID=A0A1N6V4S3_9BACT|nr:hypothetical protein O71_17736 [Pontibacter sp. BAB1700]SIQ72847.1 Putative beta-lactamase-inhibitor-like, PepSY-like [Pontibacter lucknowensis]